MTMHNVLSFHLSITLRMRPWPLEQTRHIRLPGPYLCGCDRKIDE